MKSPYLASRNQASRFSRAGSGRRGRRLRHPSRAARQGHRPEQRRNGAQSLSNRPLSTRNLRETRQKQAPVHLPL